MKFKAKKKNNVILNFFLAWNTVGYYCIADLKKLVSSKPPLDVNFDIEILPIILKIGSPPNQWDFITWAKLWMHDCSI